MTPGAAASTTGSALTSRFRNDLLFDGMSFPSNDRDDPDREEHSTNAENRKILCDHSVVPAKAGIHKHGGSSFRPTVFMDAGSSPA
jgi:hypothetical protein